MTPVAIFLYELSGQSAAPFAAAGWDCYCIDIAHERDHQKGNVRFIKADARRWKPSRDMVERCAFFAAFPPCDDLACSGARWFKGKGLHALSDAIETGQPYRSVLDPPPGHGPRHPQREETS